MDFINILKHIFIKVKRQLKLILIILNVKKSMKGIISECDKMFSLVKQIDKQYYDNYSYINYDSAVSDVSYLYRILGDATGEMGPFANISSNSSSWYKSYSNYVSSAFPIFLRGGAYNYGTYANIFSFTGSDDSSKFSWYSSFRVILTPTTYI